MGARKESVERRRSVNKIINEITGESITRSTRALGTIIIAEDIVDKRNLGTPRKV